MQRPPKKPKPARKPRKPSRKSAPGKNPSETERKNANALEPAPALDAKQRKLARGLAHGLEPLVHVGHSGITFGVVTAVARALLDHELIKVRLHEPEDKHAMADELAERTKSALCGLVGHTAILYRPDPQQPRLVLPK